MNEKMISVIIPVYNAANTIEKCLSSLLNQSYQSFVIYIINDGSTDDTKEVLKKYESNKKIKIINQSNVGVSSARNVALKYIRTKYVTFVDSDDYLDKNHLEHLIKGFKTRNVDMTISGVNHVDMNGNVLLTSDYRDGIYNKGDILEKVIEEEGPQGYLWNKMFKTQIFHKYNLKLDSNLHMAEDLVLCVQYILKSKNTVITPYRDYNYVQVDNSLSNSIVIGQKNKSGYINFLEALEKVEKIIPKDYSQAYINIRGRICHTCCDFLKMLELHGIDDINLKKSLRKKAKEYKKYLFKSTDTNVKRKISYYLTIYFPKIMQIRDKIKYQL